VIDLSGSRVVDLTQAVEPGIPVPGMFPTPSVDPVLRQSRGDIANAEILHLAVHSATHVDAPFHFHAELATVDQLDPTALIGPAVVVDLTDLHGAVAIAADRLLAWESAADEQIHPGDGVLLHTGHSRAWGLGEDGERYWRHGSPYLADDAVELLADRRIRLVGVESFDPDWVDLDDLSTATFPAHRKLLPRGVLIVENLVNLGAIAATRCLLIALPLKLRGCSGSPVRVIALV
jgi:kynurenine formamidase